MSFIGSREGMEAYASGADFKKTLRAAGVEGIELVPCGPLPETLDPGEIQGVHLPFYSSWMDYEFGNRAGLMEEFGSLEVAREFYHFTPGNYHRYFQGAMDLAQERGAYAVFHISNIGTREYFTRNFGYSHREVVAASAEVINKLLDGGKYTVPFLMENLYSPGLTFQDPDLTELILSRVNYENKGFMLDTGHFFCAHPHLATEDEGWELLEKTIREHGFLKDYIRGIHLQASITGDIQREFWKNPPPMEEEFYHRFAQMYRHVGRVDTHDLARSKRARKVIEWIDPEFLVFEFRYENRREMVARAREQRRLLGLS
ncbi:MAG: TIM barrel protein [Tissierellia bacterium]|nr:TIM barrel protein [Tissierellia bacterium]